MFCKHKYKHFSGKGGSDFYRICVECGSIHRRDIAYEGYVLFHKIKPGLLIMRLLDNSLPKLREVTSSTVEIFENPERKEVMMYGDEELDEETMDKVKRVLPTFAASLSAEYFVLAMLVPWLSLHVKDNQIIIDL